VINVREGSLKKRHKTVKNPRKKGQKNSKKLLSPPPHPNTLHLKSNGNVHELSATPTELYQIYQEKKSGGQSVFLAKSPHEFTMLLSLV